IEFREEFGDDMIYQLLDGGLDTAKKVLKAGVDEIEHSLLGSSKPEEQTVFGKTYKTSVKPRERKVTDEEKRYWKKIAENIYKTVKEQFTEADLVDLFDDTFDLEPDEPATDISSEQSVE
ncbi:MAG: transcription termination/antitermination protein NusA, partial [Chlorobiaceae bacterium]